jgi:hypothetical protein
MKRALAVMAILAASLLVAALAVTGAAKAAWKRSGREPWPLSLGALEDVPRQYPKAAPTPAALRLIELGKPLSIEFTPKQRTPKHPLHDAIAGYVRAEQQRDRAEIGEPPAAVVAFLNEREREIDALRDHLLHGGIGWEVDLGAGFDAPVPNLLGHMHASRLLIARALHRARGGDRRAWADLHAVSALERSLLSRPEMLCHLIAHAIARSVTAASWKLPPPAAPSETPVDRERLLLRALQHDTWLMWRFGVNVRSPFGRVGQPYVWLSAANMATHQRDTAEQLARVTECGFDGKTFFDERVRALPPWNEFAKVVIPDVGAAWTRARRFAAEREASANALRLRAGLNVEPQSRCSDGRWLVENDRLRFSRELPAGKTEMPLTLVISPP